MFKAVLFSSAATYEQGELKAAGNAILIAIVVMFDVFNGMLGIL